MNLELLRERQDQARTHAKSLAHRLEDRMRADGRSRFDDHEQEMVDAARRAVDQIDGQIARAKADGAMLSTIDHLAGGGRHQRHHVAAGGSRLRGSWADQLMAAGLENWLSDNRGRFGQTIASPVFEISAETLTTDDGSPGSGGALLIPEYRRDILPLPMGPLTIADLLKPGTTENNAITYPLEEEYDNAADTVPEGTVKPESTFRFGTRTDALHVIAHWIPASMQMLEDVPGLRSYIDARLRFGVLLAEDLKLLSGSDSPEELTGIRNREGLADPMAPASGENGADAILRQITRLTVNSGYPPDAIVLHPTQWESLSLLKTDDGSYLGSGPFAAPQTPRLWGLPVAVTSAIDEGVALVGSFQRCAQLFRKGGVRVEISGSHSDYFTRNLLAIRAEERVALCVYRPSAFGEVTGLD